MRSPTSDFLFFDLKIMLVALHVCTLTGCKLEFLAVKYPFSILVKMEHIHLNLGSNKKPNRYSEFFMRFSVLERIALLFENFYTKYPFMPYSNSFLSDQYSK